MRESSTSPLVSSCVRAQSSLFIRRSLITISQIVKASLALSATLKGLQSTIEGRNADIYGIAVDNGLDLSRYGNGTALFNAYTKQVDSRLANVTANVFRTPALTLAENTNSVTYGDALVLAGSLQDNQTGVTNSSVEVRVDNTTVATVRTNAVAAVTIPLAGPTSFGFGARAFLKHVRPAHK